MNLNKHLLLFICLLTYTYNNAQEYKINTVAFYNLENLFDTINDPNKYDEKSPIMEIHQEERGLVYLKKIKNMAKVISEIGVNYRYTKNCPVIMGVCEVENKKVLYDLIADPKLRNKKYDFIHFDSPDSRGIDVALLYQKKIFKPLSSRKHELLIYNQETNKRIFTRDQLVVSGLLDGEEIICIVNHWPSRRGGEVKSSLKRVSAARLTKKIVDSLQTINPYAKIIIMGDFNDDPYNKSLKKILNAKAKIEIVKLGGIYNPMMQMSKKGMGSLAYRDKLNIFDQLLFTKSFLNKDYSSYKVYKTGIYNPLYITNRKGKYKNYPLRSFTNSKWAGGYSDHFPVYSYLIKKVN